MSKVVFESNMPYRRVMRSAFVGIKPLYGDVFDKETGVTTHNVVMGKTGSFVYPYDDKGYTFMEGENHNQLTLTDDEEIAGMRAFIKGTGIKEVSSEE